MKIAVIGCGFVSDYYFCSFRDRDEIEIKFVYDTDSERAKLAAKTSQAIPAASYQEILGDPEIELVLNLTNPRSHFEVTRLALEHDKHVYSEKPLGMSYEECRFLFDLANDKNLLLASAPCGFLGESAQTLKKAVDEGLVGQVRLVYAEMDDGPIHKMNPESWTSVSGHPWPIADEYEVGCTLEHAGYCINVLVAIFGEVEHVNAYADCLIKDKGVADLAPSDTPDFSVATIRFRSGVVARLTCSIVAPHNHEMLIVGDQGELKIDEIWHYGSPVKYRPFSLTAHKAERYTFIRNSKILSFIFGLSFKKLPFTSTPNIKMAFKKDYMDYARGVIEVSKAIKSGSEPSISSKFSLHVNEVTLAIHNAKLTPGSYTMRSRLS